MTNAINTDEQTKELAARGNKHLPIIEISGNTIKILIYVVRGQQVILRKISFFEVTNCDLKQ